MLYLIESQGFLKIGFSNDIDKRIDSYHTENPKFEVISIREGDRKDESYLHFLFKDYIDHREWMKYENFIVKLFSLIKLPSESDLEHKKEIKELREKNTDLYTKNLRLGEENSFFRKRIKEYKEIIEKSNEALEESNKVIQKYNEYLSQQN